ncbi:hypothetical protein EVAR_63289_1 [Eumeta japonica]|uniref:Uncharacterized protein n=1 Tax=Eumeta variegata TaxID=151549 RepID=A0A4C2A0Y6_EUMVA|nr:hypothetical protein EVAR_63289_1 [Eumeta japonica]
MLANVICSRSNPKIIDVTPTRFSRDLVIARNAVVFNMTVALKFIIRSEYDQSVRRRQKEADRNRTSPSGAALMCYFPVTRPFKTPSLLYDSHITPALRPATRAIDQDILGYFKFFHPKCLCRFGRGPCRGKKETAFIHASPPARRRCRAEPAGKLEATSMSKFGTFYN